MSEAKRLSAWTWLLGLLAVFAYWWHLHPQAGGLMGYSGDLGTIELTRQVIADNLREAGHPTFFTTRFMAPTGISAAFFSWAMERDWLGAYAWMASKDFPWLWVYFGLSLLITYVGVGALSRKMGLPRVAAWGLAACLTVFNIPRHLKTFHHYEHTIHHWVYLAFFLDAWIWQRFWKENRVSLNLELWRLVLLGACFGLAGYYWGPMILLWELVRLCMLFTARSRRKKGMALTWEWSFRKALLPVALGLSLLVIELRWFLPLFKQVKEVGSVFNGLGWPGSLFLALRPIWGDTPLVWLQERLPILGRLRLAPYDMPETAVTIGWLYWFPLFWLFPALKKKNGGPGFGAIRPFLIFVGLAMIYFGGGVFHLFQNWLQALVPFMVFFRVTSRMGLYLVPAVGAMLALLWPELRQRVPLRWPERRFKWIAAFFLVSSLVELSYLALPVTIAPAIPKPFQELIDAVKATPGTTVLDFPFCVVGGNGVCSEEQCPNYPMSTAAATLTGLHDKKVYGIYLGRLTEAQCTIYRKAPYTEWFDAWRGQRCLSDNEWQNFCAYSESHPELSGVLVYPEIWTAAKDPACRSQLEARLGAPLKEAEFVAKIERGNTDIRTTSVLFFQPRCKPTASKGTP